MTRYIGTRVGQALVVVLAVALFAFLLMHVIPGNPARLVAGSLAPQSTVNALRHQLGLDRPVLTQFWDFLSGLPRGHFGESITQHASVASLIGPRIEPTALLIAYALTVALVTAVPLAVLSARNKNRPVDHAIRVGAMVPFAMPPFWLVLLMVLLLSLRLHLLPVSGYGTGLGGHLESLTIPAVALGLTISAMFLRTLRAAMIDTLTSDYVEAARARGLGEFRVWTRYVLRNSLTATVTLIGFMAGVLIGWAVVVETVANIPGLGSLVVQAVSERDYPTVQVLVVMAAAAVVTLNLVTDLMYVLLDPRVRL